MWYVHCLLYASVIVTAYLSLVLQYVVFPFSALLMAAGYGKIQPAAQVQHPRWYPPQSAEISGNEHDGRDKGLNTALLTQGPLSRGIYCEKGSSSPVGGEFYL